MSNCIIQKRLRKRSIFRIIKQNQKKLSDITYKCFYSCNFMRMDLVKTMYNLVKKQWNARHISLLLLKLKYRTYHKMVLFKGIFKETHLSAKFHSLFFYIVVYSTKSLIFNYMQLVSEWKTNTSCSQNKNELS